MPGSVPNIPGLKAEGSLLSNMRREVAQLLGRQNHNFPGAQPISFARRHIQELCQEDYFLCEKTDGIRCLLYCSDDGNGAEIHYLIDRKNDYYYVQGLHFPHHDDPTFARFHKDTLIDGELVLDTYSGGKEQLRYLVFDCMVLDGEPLLSKPLDKRIGRFQSFVFSPFKALFKKFPDEKKYIPFDVSFKIMDKPYALEAMFKDKLPNLPHGNDGLVFTCKSSTYVTGTDEHILKWKPAHENSIDFKLVLGEFPKQRDETGVFDDFDAKPTFQLYVYYGNNQDYRYFDELFFTDAQWDAMKALNQQLDGRIIECYRDEEGKWRYKNESNGAPRFRDDKETANHISTVEKVLQSIDDGVTEADLIAAEPAIRDAWKHRHPEEEAMKKVQMAQRPPPPPVNGHSYSH